MAKSPPKSSAKKTVRNSAPAGDENAAGAVQAPDDALPGKEEIAALQDQVRVFAQSPRFGRARAFLERFAHAPPQVLLLEGGNADERLAAAHYWAALLNCGQTQAGSNAEPPCLNCPDCVRMLTHLHRDCFFFDGLAASIKIDDVRGLRSVLGEPPREARHRVVIFREAQALVEAAANALLKSFEEPRPGTSFLMSAPQRERLLPTLVSRSVTLTLPWPLNESVEARELLAPWENALCSFLQTGRDFFEQSGARGAVDAPLVHAISNMCRRALASCLGADADCGYERLKSLFSRIPEQRLRMLDEALAECQDSLILGVNPVLVLEWLATRLFFLVPRG